MNNKLAAYFKLMRLDRPIGIFLLLWPTAWALILTKTTDLTLIIVFAVGVILMRSAGCVINDIADIKFDAKVKRTNTRPLVCNMLTKKDAFRLLVFLLLCSFMLLFFLPYLSWIVACVSALFAMIYPFVKRVSHFPQVVLAIAFSSAILMVYSATVFEFPLSCWLLFFANICWTIAYDTKYAMVDKDDDVLIGVKSTAIIFGRFDRLIIALLELIMLALLIAVALILKFSVVFYCFLFSVGLLFIYQQALISTRERQHCFRAFMNNNAVGLLIFIGLLNESF